jgi:hypothetical protein
VQTHVAGADMSNARGRSGHVKPQALGLEILDHAQEVLELDKTLTLIQQQKNIPNHLPPCPRLKV